MFAAALGIFALAQEASAQATAFDYQGKLEESGVAANGAFQMQFKLFDSLGGAGQIGSTIADLPVTATQGTFLVRLDFGANALSGADRWLEIGVRHNAGEGYTTLAPRNRISSAPYSVRTLSAASADNALNLGGVSANQYLQNNGNGAGLTNLSADSIATGTLNNARLGLVPTANIADSAVTAPKIAGAQVVKSLNSLKDNVTLAAGTNITITPTAGTLTIASTSGGVGGSGATNSIPFWSASTTLGNSQITQSVNGLQLPNNVQLAVGAQGNQMSFGSPNGETGISLTGAAGRADMRFDGTTLKLFAGPAGSPPGSGIAITPSLVQFSKEVSLAPTASGNNVSFGSPNGETGMTISGPTGRADVRFDGTTLRLLAGPPSSGPPSNGIAISPAGNVTQGRASNGLAKAMIAVNANGTISSCFNGITNSSTGNCGFGVANSLQGIYTITFNFQVNDRFVSVSPQYNSNIFHSHASFVFTGVSIVEVELSLTSFSPFGDPPVESFLLNNPFMIIIF